MRLGIRNHRSTIPILMVLATLVVRHHAQSEACREPQRNGQAPKVDEADILAPVTLQGVVLQPDGGPAEGALVFSSAGGKAVADARGSFRLEIAVALEAESVQLTAVGIGAGSLVASRTVAPFGPSWVGSLQLAQVSSCTASWLPTFGQTPTANDYVWALTTFDDGSGPALYAGGSFTTAGGVLASRIAKWDGVSWTAVGSGMNGAVQALTVFDDGAGEELYAGGAFTTAGGVSANRIAKWDGSSWAAAGSGLNDGVFALTVFDDGAGEELYAGGTFTTADGVTANRVAKWDGTSWTAVGSVLSDIIIYALTVFDDGSGARLYAGGRPFAPGLGFVVKWTGADWVELGIGFNHPVSALTVFDDGGGHHLYAGGDFTTADAATAIGIAKWDGLQWDPLGASLQNPVISMTVFDDGGGAALYAGSYFTFAAGPARIVKWDGTTWSAVGGGLGNDGGVALGVFDDGSGPSLVAAGGDRGTFGVGEGHLITRWDGAEWKPLGNGLNGAVYAIAAFDDGGGPALYAAGNFGMVDGVEAIEIAKWNGTSWSPLGSGLNSDSSKWAMTVFDDGSGPALYVGSNFTMAGGVSANYIAKWDGLSWTALGSGMDAAVEALTVFDDGGGPALYAGGDFSTAGGVSASSIAKWDGTSWAALESGMDGYVFALTVFDYGNGPALYAGGTFSTAGSVTAHRMAKWDGANWAALGSGISGGFGPGVESLAVFDDGGGPALYVGGLFTTAGGVSAKNIARWDGATWTAVGAGVNDRIFALTAFDDGQDAALYAGGVFTTAGGITANRAARWNGASWSPLGSGVNSVPGFQGVRTLVTFDDGGGMALYAGGEFPGVIDSGDSYLARWDCVDMTAPVLSCPMHLLVGDRIGSPPGEIVHFSVTATDDNDPSPSVVCAPPSGSLFARGNTLVTCTATDTSGNQSTCEFTVTVARGIRKP